MTRKAASRAAYCKEPQEGWFHCSACDLLGRKSSPDFLSLTSSDAWVCLGMITDQLDQIRRLQTTSYTEAIVMSVSGRPQAERRAAGTSPGAEKHLTDWLSAFAFL